MNQVQILMRTFLYIPFNLNYHQSNDDKAIESMFFSKGRKTALMAIIKSCAQHIVNANHYAIPPFLFYITKYIPYLKVCQVFFKNQFYKFCIRAKKCRTLYFQVLEFRYYSIIRKVKNRRAFIGVYGNNCSA